VLGTDILVFLLIIRIHYHLIILSGLPVSQ